MKKRLLLLVPNLAMGGQQRVFINTAAILQSEYDLTLAVFSMENSAYTFPSTIVDLKVPAADSTREKVVNLIRRSRNLKKLKQTLEIDVTYSFGKTANIANAFSKANDKTIISIHGYSSISHSCFGKFIDKRVYDKADTIVCVAEKISRDLANIFHVPTNKVNTLYNPYDFENIKCQSQALIPMEIRHPALVAMGRMEKVKGYRHLINAFIKIQNKLPGTTLVFIGDGGERQALEKMVNEMGLEKHVFFVGFQSNPYSYLAKCDLFILSSINEGFPNAMIEAMACGLPVIATDCKSGPREILTEAYCDRTTNEVELADYGILTPPFAADDSSEPELDQLYADAILYLLKEKDVYQHYKQKSKDRAVVFSFDAYKKKVIEIIDK